MHSAIDLTRDGGLLDPPCNDDAFLASLVECSPQAIFSLTLEGVIRTWNRAATKLYGYSSLDVIGRPLTMLAPPTKYDEITKAFSVILTDDRGKLYETQQLTKDGALIDVCIAVGPIHDASGRKVGISAIGHDISQYKCAQQQLAQKTEELERSNSELEQFAYVASHDLQEPLRMVTSYVQMLARRYRGKLDPDADDFINYAVDGAIRMRELIKNLLTYSRAGKARPFVSIDFGSLLDKVVANLALQIKESGAAISHDPMPSIRGDEPQLCQLVQNLLSNSIKFHDHRRLVIHFGAQRRDTDWLFYVRDNGIGIDPKYHDRIFTMFQRLHAQNEYPGSGIGLAICRRIIERHGGKMWVESKLGEGSTFYFTIPASQ
jgi:PAS domain S-box-containing protein